jgi:putative ABC transport system substrate-binding protein
MRRRDFIILIGGAANTFSCAKAFAAKTLARIGILAIGPLPKDVQLPDMLTPALCVFVATTGCEAILVQYVALTITYRRQIAEMALRHRLPSIYEVRAYVDAGGLISSGTVVKENFRLTAHYVDRILKGARPRDLPVIEASHFELVINLKTAKSLGLTVPSSLLVRADEVIE